MPLVRGERPEFGEIESGSLILKFEVEKAVRGIKWRKTEGSACLVIVEIV